MTKNQHFSVFTTGGTIDGSDCVKGTSRVESDAVKWLEKNATAPFTATKLFNKDSREITDDDRKLIVESVTACADSYILITHGTFTIAETGRVLQRSLDNISKTLLLVGAWIPFHEENSDAPQQMTYALSQLFSAPSGVWIAMDKKLWDPEFTEKRATGQNTFELVATNHYKS